MTPTLLGRIQTRLFLLIVVGIPWTILVTPFLPGFGGIGQELGDRYAVTFAALAFVALAGCIVWDPIYQGLTYFRWEKDWPTLFTLLAGFHEGILAWLLLNTAGPMSDAQNGATLATFLVHFTTTWLLVWVSSFSLVRVLFLRHRFRGGRIL